MRFTENLLTFNNSYRRENNAIRQELLPSAYSCPEPSSCLGGVHSQCATGYQGPLCAVCVNKYYKLLTRCLKCPTLPWLVVQVFLVAAVVFVLIYFTVKERRKPKGQKRSASDAFLAKLKIVVGFYQVTSATLDGFSYIQWPQEMITLINYAKMIQLNILQIAPIHCFSDSLQISIYDRLFVILAFNVIFVTAALVWYYLKSYQTKRRRDLNDIQKRRRRQFEQERCLRITFLFLFVVYSSTTSAIFQILPLSCQEVCSGSSERKCHSYLKYDYSVSCESPKYKRYLPVFYLLLAYPLVLPLATLVLLRYSFSDKWKKQRKETFKRGLRFLYENYEPHCWYWEIVDIARKIVLTSAILLANTESRSYLLFLSVSSGLYAILFASYKPIGDRFEYWLQTASIISSWTNLMVGLLLKIPKDEFSSLQTRFDSVVITIMLVSTNVFVVALVAGKCTLKC